jgi:hypothetical protein
MNSINLTYVRERSKLTKMAVSIKVQTIRKSHQPLLAYRSAHAALIRNADGIDSWACDQSPT